MNKQSCTVIGLMSGTSLDGLDMACCKFSKVAGQWEYEIIATRSISYGAHWQYKLKDAFTIEAEELSKLDIEYGAWVGNAVKQFIADEHLVVDFVASHGHTIFHQPEEGITVQIGSGQEIASVIDKKVICDFRKRDVSLGGQGAPLVPIGDEFLFGEYKACVNLGGIANISFRIGSKRVAFDIGMANMLLNYIINKVDKPYDKSGSLARTGMVDAALLGKLNDLEYHTLPFPKSTGYEWFLSDIKPIIDISSLSVANLLATAVEHEAIQLGLVLKKYLTVQGEVLITGGGVLNDYLIERISHYCPDHLNIIVPDLKTINFKEALVFAFMGVLKYRNEVNCLKSVTGASEDSSVGELFDPKI